MGIIKDIFKVFNGSTWDEHYFKTTSDQVVHTKSDGTATTVQAELLAQNSALTNSKIDYWNLSEKNVTNTRTSYTLSNNRKFSDYDLICAIVQDSYIKDCVTIPTNILKLTKNIEFGYGGSSGYWVDVYYTSDTTYELRGSGNLPAGTICKIFGLNITH